MNIWKTLWLIFFRDYRTHPDQATRQQARFAMRGAARTYAAQKRIKS